MENKEITSKIVFIKTDKKNDDNDITFDAINHYISSLDSCKELKFIDYYYIDNNKEFQISDKIFCKVQLSEIQDKNIQNYSIELYSYILKLSELKTFINSLKKKYIYERNNKLDNLKYYFDQHYTPLMKNSNQSIKYSTAPNKLTFTMTQFNTNKSLKNVFGNHLKLIKERMDLFSNNPDWYKEKGIPYTLGILLHGPPGTGKTSIIKAIAKDTNRHIFNIKLYDDTTKTQLRNLFFNENVKVIKDGKTEVYNIPLNERIYVMEDVDCDNELLLDRKYKTIKKNKKQPDNTAFQNSFEYRYDEFFPGQTNYSTFNTEQQQNNNNNNNKNIKYPEIEEDTSEQLTLSFILNLLDGILETPGRILIMTSNYPEKLDKALIRPGRIDINLKVGYCDIDMIKEMFQFFYNIPLELPNDISESIKNITPAGLNKILLDNFNNPINAKIQILETIL